MTACICSAHFTLLPFDSCSNLWLLTFYRSIAVNALKNIKTNHIGMHIGRIYRDEAYSMHSRSLQIFHILIGKFKVEISLSFAYKTLHSFSLFWSFLRKLSKRTENYAMVQRTNIEISYLRTAQIFQLLMEN